MSDTFVKLSRGQEAIHVIEIIGKTMFGSRWQTEVARVLKVDSRTVRRWASGEAPIPLARFQELAQECDRRASILTDAAYLGREFSSPYWKGLEKFRARPIDGILDRFK